MNISKSLFTEIVMFIEIVIFMKTGIYGIVFHLYEH
jgi:hypothetical protein